MNKYLVKDYTNTSEPVLTIVTEAELFDYLDHAKRHPEVKIAVYRLGERLLDWS
jgi:hypothetical protein